MHSHSLPPSLPPSPSIHPSLPPSLPPSLLPSPSLPLSLLIFQQVLRRGAHVNDKDGLTDLSLLHFASKAGAVGIGNGTTAANLVNTLLNKVWAFIS